MSVNDEVEHPWLGPEKRLIAEAVRTGVPFFGACLGVQLLASSLGAEVSAGETPEVGVLPVYATEAGLCRSGVLRSRVATADASVARRHVRAPRRRDAARDVARVPAPGVPGR